MIEGKAVIEKNVILICFFFTFHVFFGIIYVLLWRAHKKDILGKKGTAGVAFFP